MWQPCCWDTKALLVCDKLWRAVAEVSNVALFNKTCVELRVVVTVSGGSADFAFPPLPLMYQPFIRIIVVAAPTSNHRNRDWALLKMKNETEMWYSNVIYLERRSRSAFSARFSPSIKSFRRLASAKFPAFSAWQTHERHWSAKRDCRVQKRAKRTAMSGRKVQSEGSS